MEPANPFGIALMEFTEQISDLAAAVAAHRKRLVDEHGFTEGAAEAICVHLHARMVDLMCTPKLLR